MEVNRWTDIKISAREIYYGTVLGFVHNFITQPKRIILNFKFHSSRRASADRLISPGRPGPVRRSALDAAFCETAVWKVLTKTIFIIHINYYYYFKIKTLQLGPAVIIASSREIESSQRSSR